MKTEQKKEIFDYWNNKGIVAHRKLTHDIEVELGRTLNHYTIDEVKEYIDFYTTILEPGVEEKDKKYFWSYKWNLYEFLRRGIKKFDGQELKNYLNKKVNEAPTAVIIKRK